MSRREKILSAQTTTPPSRYAAVDIGTVTCRMLIADVDRYGFLHELDRECEITNLGEGTDASGMLSACAMRRVSEVIKRYRMILESFRVRSAPPIKVFAVATSAARDAKNADEFEALMNKAGIALSIISGQKEAALSFSGAARDFLGENLLVVDIGGGSTEMIAGRAGEKPCYARSFDVGCRRITERFFSADPPDTVQLQNARRWIIDCTRPFFCELKDRKITVERIVAVAGTATSVVSVHEEMKVYDSPRVHKTTVSRAVLDEVYKRLVSMPLSKRKQVTGLDPGRAPVIIAGLLILQEVLSLAQIDSFTVSESDILHGIILDMANS